METHARRRGLRAVVHGVLGLGLIVAIAACASSTMGGSDEACDGGTCTPDASALDAPVVPSLGRLCQTCETNEDCGSIGNNLCLQRTINGDNSESGTSFCSKDCSDQACPDGYVCENVQNQRQCLPAMGTCDCNESFAGLNQACQIDTGRGLCNAQSICLGASGWSTCTALSEVDEPDGEFIDSDCDGFDGMASNAVFVKTTGANDAACGASPELPCQTISQGLSRAKALGRTTLFVAAGEYPEQLTLNSAVNLVGGFDENWQRGPQDDPAHRTILVGGFHYGVGQPVALLVKKVSDPIAVVGFTIKAADASLVFLQFYGQSSYGIYVTESEQVQFREIRVWAGAGADGFAGANGGSAANILGSDGFDGMSGGDGGEGASFCSTAKAAGGAQGKNAGCPTGNGGSGGGSGGKDTSCGFNPDWDATSGVAGKPAATVSGGSGQAGTGGGTCKKGGKGGDGKVVNGMAGAAASPGGLIKLGFWYSHVGGAGGVGENGTGGGGGGGSGGCDSGTDSRGAGGGGGGAGGCKASSGGGPGASGGASIGIMVVRSNVTLSDCEIARGQGGKGGDGGTGGTGQRGGNGGYGGDPAGDSLGGGDGGMGGHGGHGGGGAGANGGDSIGILAVSSQLNSSCTVSGGFPGIAGKGGKSGQLAMPSWQDGQPGPAGHPGMQIETLSIADP